MKPLKNIVVYLLAAVLLWSLLPAVSAVDGDPVLTSLKHVYTDEEAVSDPGTTIELKVAASYTVNYGTTVDLSNGLTPGYNTTLYKNVVAAPAGPVTVGGSPVTLDVSFNNSSDPDGAEKSHTVYTVIVTSKAAVDPTFSGSLAKETAVLSSATFNVSDFQSRYTANDGGDLGYISISGSNPAFGFLKYNSDPYGFGTLIDIDQITRLTFAASAAGTISYDVTAYSRTDTGTPKQPIGNVVLTITAITTVPPTIRTPILDSVAKGTVRTFDAGYFTSRCNMSGLPLDSVEITPTNTSYGTWSTGTTPFTGAKTILAADLGGLTFTATAPGTATFGWRVSSSAGISAAGSGAITVMSSTVILAPFAAPVPILKGTSHAVSAADFVYTPATASLTYIKLTTLPAATDGYIYLTAALPKDTELGYPALSANTALPVNAVIPVSHVGLLRVASKTTSPNSQVSFKWTATTDLKVTSATWGEPTTYTVSFVTGGTVPCATDMNVPVALPAAQIIGQFQNVTYRTLSYVTFVLPDKNAGTLYYKYDLTTMKGTAVTAAAKYYTGKNPNLAAITYVPAKDFTGQVSVTYNAYAEDGSTISGTIVITVANSSGGTLALRTDKNTPLQFDAGDFQSAFQAATGVSLHRVVFILPPASSGTLYYKSDALGRGGTAVAPGSVYYVTSSPYLSQVSFVPALNFTGTVPITFSGITAGGVPYTGKVIVSVVDSAGGVVTYTVTENGTVALSGADFSGEFLAVTGSLLSFVTFTPPQAASGMLYDKYDPAKGKGTSVSAATKYYDGKNPDISGLTFVPARDLTGTVLVSYKAFNAAGQSYDGKLKFVVSQSTQVISYETAPDSFVTMKDADFQSDFVLLSGRTLSAVTFELPSPAYGKLYYKYKSPESYDSAVSSATKYTLNAEPFLSGVSFVPTAGYGGSFTFSYTGYATDGAAFTGKIRITVTGTSSGSIKYTTNSLTPVTFRAADFIAAHKADGTLSYVQFSPLPYPSYGTLYFGYTSASSPGTPVAAAAPYFAGGTPSISGITFVPNSGYTGTVAVAYTAYSSTGKFSSGTVLITVKGAELADVVYTAIAGEAVQLNAEDFNAVFQKKAGQSLSYVVFAPTSAALGALYLGYAAPGVYTATVTEGAKYYRTYSPRLSDISFVPRAGFTGSVSVSYTGYTAYGTSYAGKIVVNVVAASPFRDITEAFDWAAPAVSYLYSKGIVKGGGDQKYHPTDNVTRGDFILMVTRAFNLTSSSTDNFSDVPLGTYYYSAVATAKYYGIVTGSDGKFSPGAYLSRQDAMVILNRTLNAKGISIAQGTAGDLSVFSDASQVSDYAVSAMASLVRAGILTGSDGKLNPRSMITRAEMAVILYRVLVM